MTYFVLGIEPFEVAEVCGTHSSKKTAINQAQCMEKNKNPLCCQRYTVMTVTEAKKKYELYSCGGIITCF
jgi:hypothetical protein